MKENLEAKVVDDFLFITRTNLKWRNIVMDHALDEFSNLLKQVDSLKEILVDEIKFIDVKIMGN